MKTSFFTLFLINVCNLLTVCSSHAFLCPDGYYVSGLGAITSHRDTEFNEVVDIGGGALLPIHANIDYRIGYGLGAAVGAIICRDWRLEIEGYFRNNEAKRVTYYGPIDIANIPGAGVTYSPHLHERSFSLMANAFYDYSPCECVKFFIGGGIGIAWVHWRIFAFANQNPDIKQHYYRFAFQGIAGVAYRLCNNLWATADYRLWGRMKKKNMHAFTGAQITLSDATVPLVSSIELGLRWVF